MNKIERRAAFSLSSVFAFRMLGLFMILPVFSLYAEHLKGVTPFLIGLALGIYGLTQALLQIPFGMMSDRFGRKPIIAFGLIVFAIGSVIAAMSHTIEGVIIGRALQGAGAIGSTLIALLADLTTEENRTKAMATIGLTIGFAFTLAMILGPILNNIIHVDGIFWLTAGLAIIGLIFTFTWIPTPQKSRLHLDAEPVPALFKKILKDKELLRLDFGIFALHAILTASFVVVPLALTNLLHFKSIDQSLFYLPVILLAFIAMVPMIIIAEKRRKMKAMFIFGIGLIIASQLGLAFFHHNVFILGTLLFIFFTAFTFLEASLPSLISKRAPAGSKGTAMGVYSSSQFFGIFIGGMAGGWLYGHFSLETVFLGCGILALLWMVLAFTMQEPSYVATQMLNVGKMSKSDAASVLDKLNQLAGVKEAIIIAEEGVAYLKVDSKIIDKEQLMKFSKTDD